LEWRFQITVTGNGSAVAVGEFSREGAAPGVTVTDESIAATGFFGQFWKPPQAARPGPRCWSSAVPKADWTATC